MISQVDFLSPCPIFRGMHVGVTHHALDLALVKSRTAADRHFLLFPGILVSCRDVQNPVRIDIKRDLDLRHAASRRTDTLETKATEVPIVSCHVASPCNTTTSTAA